MREIKFRVWSNKRNKYIKEVGDFDLVLSLNGDLCINEYGDMIGTSLLELTVEQYTGLKDKNGVDIYEGDILNWHETEFDGDGRFAEIIWHTKAFMLKHENGWLSEIEVFVNKPLKYEVTGNIHEK